MCLRFCRNDCKDEIQHTSRLHIVQGWVSTDGFHSVSSMVEIWIPVIGGQTTTDAGFHGQSDRDMTLQADFTVKLSLDLAGCAKARHICQINDNPCKIYIIQTNDYL